MYAPLKVKQLIPKIIGLGKCVFGFKHRYFGYCIYVRGVLTTGSAPFPEGIILDPFLPGLGYAAMIASWDCHLGVLMVGNQLVDSPFLKEAAVVGSPNIYHRCFIMKTTPK